MASLQERTFLNFKKTSPVTNPDKGSHYLKKSPSPTGAKSPPGTDGSGRGIISPSNQGEEVTLSPTEEYLQRKAIITSPQKVRMS